MADDLAWDDDEFEVQELGATVGEQALAEADNKKFEGEDEEEEELEKPRLPREPSKVSFAVSGGGSLHMELNVRSCPVQNLWVLFFGWWVCGAGGALVVVVVLVRSLGLEANGPECLRRRQNLTS